MSQLQQIISNLEAKPEIDAVFVTGSQGIKEENDYSDIDLGVIINQCTDMKSLFQWVDDKPCEVHFFTREVLNSILTKEFISPNDPEGLIVSLLEKADIQFDKTKELASYKNTYEDIKKKLQVPENKKVWFEGIINCAYITNKRYFENNNSEYHEVLEVKFLADFDLLLKGYFEFRNIPWRGEKQVLKYLKASDRKFYNLYMLGIKAPSLKEKFDIYSDLVKIVFDGDFEIWNKDAVRAFSGQSLTREGQDYLTNYWRKLSS